MTLFTTGEGNTPLTPDEQADLIPNLATKEELNQWERENILLASSSNGRGGRTASRLSGAPPRRFWAGSKP
jgi:hypothetical protein